MAWVSGYGTQRPFPLIYFIQFGFKGVFCFLILRYCEFCINQGPEKLLVLYRHRLI